VIELKYGAESQVILDQSTVSTMEKEVNGKIDVHTTNKRA